MERLINWMTESFAPKANKIAKNPWIAGIQDSILTAMPMIFIGSFATILSIVKIYWKSFPDFGMISNFSFGLFSIFLAYLIPENIMIKKKHRGTSKQAGLAGIAFFLMLIFPSFDDNNIMSIDFAKLGAGGMIAALVAGLFVAFIMNLFAKFSFFKEESSIPDFIMVWFDTLIPIIVVLLIGWLFTFQLEISLFEVINSIFSPLIGLGQSFWGFVIVVFLGYSFLYSFGISSWILYPIETAIALPGIQANMDLVAKGLNPTNIFVDESITLFVIGGGGTTLALCIMLAFLAKSKRLRVIGKAAIVPSIFNINEPLVFGAPMAFNPILMIPMWIMGIVGPALTYIVMKIGILPIPEVLYNLWYLPAPVSGYLITKSIIGVVYVLIIFAISWLVYLPFFKAYDKQVLREELEEK